MGGCGATEGDRARRTPAMLMPIVRAWGDFPIATVQDNRQVDPRMVMERPVVIRAQHLVEVDVDEPISRDHPPATHVGVLLATNDEVRRTAINKDRKSTRLNSLDRKSTRLNSSH